MSIFKIQALIVEMSDCKLWIENKPGHCSNPRKYFSFYQAFKYEKEETQLTSYP